MKRIIALLLVCAFVCVAFVGCSTTGDCDLCNKKDVEVTELEYQGEEGYFCEDCAPGVEALVEIAEAAN